ncbi:MAG TPA: RDD family protein [Thermoanaerobaculia bacterium]|nr:RDD family protein [Thermoanaerobaculia bacterium]
MRRPSKPQEPDEPLLFDLPLSGFGEEAPADPPVQERPARPARAAAPRPVAVPAPEPDLDDEDEPVAASEYASRGSRLAAGGADLLVHAAAGVLALAGTLWLGIRPALADLPALAVFLLSFSFLYTVLPLAFWGHTLGMAWTGITSRNRDGEPLTFDQTARRWLGGILTAATLGLPLLVTGDRRSLTDGLSGSATYPEPGPV